MAAKGWKRVASKYVNTNIQEQVAPNIIKQNNTSNVRKSLDTLDKLIALYGVSTDIALAMLCDGIVKTDELKEK